MKTRIYLSAMIGLLLYNIFFIWAMGRSSRIAIPAYPVLNLKLIVGILLIFIIQILIFIPILRLLWNNILVKRFLFNKITYYDSLIIYTFLLFFSLILRQHNILVFLIRLFSI